MSQPYRATTDGLFAPVVEAVTTRAEIRPGERVLDLGTGTGAAAARAAGAAMPGGSVLAVDPSPEMVKLAQERAAEPEAAKFTVVEGSAEDLPADDRSFDVAIASLSLMYVVDRGAAANELARVLDGGGRLVACVWAEPESCDIVRFQQIVGSFAPTPPVPGVGPGALADPSPFLSQLAEAGIEAEVERRVLGFELEDFETAWEVLAGVTTAGLEPERRQEAMRAVQEAMWPHPERPRSFSNTTQFIVGSRS